jgi:hypothetical protein
MTSTQKFAKYLPAWAAVVKVHGWRMDRATHRLVGERRETWGGPETTLIYQRTWQHAQTLGRRECRVPRPDDLRHGVHVAALARDISSTRLDNIQLDRVLVAFHLLTEPDDLAAMDAWLHPERGERRRRVWWLSQCCHPAYVAKVARDMFGVADWRYLDDHRLGILYGRVKHRPGAARRAREAAAEQPQPAAADDDYEALAAQMTAEPF